MRPRQATFALKQTSNFTLRLVVSISLPFVLAGCGTRHSIRGTTYGWNADARRVEVLLDAQMGKLRVRHVRMKNSEVGFG